MRFIQPDGQRQTLVFTATIRLRPSMIPDQTRHKLPNVQWHQLSRQTPTTTSLKPPEPACDPGLRRCNKSTFEKQKPFPRQTNTPNISSARSPVCQHPSENRRAHTAASNGIVIPP
ncbi:hypothetical protein ElyMa_002688800 [Elysia marginata]|uniref:Uncharacterized protein n=1 Tax=Elysia marginata TaxID=1093978 RepID=A0AAV4HAU1_9GAST|nr:hypothetical protein ElyMa_002688800 [Elysia marginata]